jgi:hypothetical protein
MAKKLRIEEIPKKAPEERKGDIQVNFRITKEEDRILWAIQYDRSMRSRTHAVRYFLLLGLKSEGHLDPKVADKMIDDAKKGRFYDSTPVLSETATASKRRDR